ncbi:MAG: sugar-binding protein [Calditrichaceae bacterium]
MLNSKKYLIYFVLLFVLCSNIFAQFLIPTAKIAPAIDGQMDPAWDYAARDSIQNIFSGEAPPSSSEDFSIEFRMLWDENNIYLLALWIYI